MNTKKYPHTYEYFKARLHNLETTLLWYKSECEKSGVFNLSDRDVLKNLLNDVYTMQQRETESIRDHINRITENEYMMQVDDMGRYLQEKYLPELLKVQATKQKMKDGL